jgi:hypothetical protein
MGGFLFFPIILAGITPWVSTRKKKEGRYFFK